MSRMPRRQFLYVLAGTAGAAALWSRNRDRLDNKDDSTGDLRTFQRTSWALGSSVSLTVMHASDFQAESAMSAAFGELELVEQLMSLYRPDSQLCQLNRDRSLNNPHPYLVEVLNAARAMSERTEGAFDITVQPLWNLYSTAHKSGGLPSEADVATTRDLVDWRKVEFDSSKVRLTSPGTAVTLNGIAQGFAADRVAAVLRQHGVEHALVDTGELGAVGAKPNGDGWKIGIQHPRESDSFLSLAKLAGRCLATSGDYSTQFSADHLHNHLFDPRTGHSPTELSSVSIAAATALEADALSTAVFIMGTDAGLRLIEKTANADALLVLKDGSTVDTPGFPLAS
jgi:thiamine biosynthesis lipoprotein